MGTHHGKGGVAIFARKSHYTSCTRDERSNSNMVGIRVTNNVNLVQQWWYIYMPVNQKTRNNIWSTNFNEDNTYTSDGRPTFHRGDCHSTLDRWLVQGPWQGTGRQQGSLDHDMIILHTAIPVHRHWRFNCKNLKDDELTTSINRYLHSQVPPSTMKEWEDIKEQLRKLLIAHCYWKDAALKEKKPWLKIGAKEDSVLRNEYTILLQEKVN